MRAIDWQPKGWTSQSSDVPKLDSPQWVLANLLGLLLIVMAVLQAASFNDFKETLTLLGLTSESLWAIAIIGAEAIAAIGFFKVPLSATVRMLTSSLAVLVAGFWFIENLQLISNGNNLLSSGFFGRFLNQSPGWWTAIEATVLLFWTVYIVGLYKDSMTTPKRK